MMKKIFLIWIFSFFYFWASAEITPADREKITQNHHIVMGFFMEDFEDALRESQITIIDKTEINSRNPAIYGYYRGHIPVIVQLKDCELEFKPQFCAGALVSVMITDGKIPDEALNHYWWAHIWQNDNERIEVGIPLSLAYVEYDRLKIWFFNIIEMINTITGEPK